MAKDEAKTVFDFELAVRAFELFTLTEKARALGAMITFEYPSVRDRFFEGVHAVIREHEKAMRGEMA